MIKKLAKVLKLLVPLIIAFFVGRVIHANWQQVREAEWQFSPLYLIGSFALCSGWFLFRPLGWNIILNRFGRHVPYAAVFRVYRQSELSRYVPGAVWQFVSRIYLIKRWHVTASACMAATIVDLVLATLAALIPASWTLQEAFPGMQRYHQIVLMVFPVASLLVIHPRAFNAWAGFLAERLRQPWTPLRITWVRLLGIWALYVAGWLMMCTGVAMFASGILAMEPGGSMYLGSSYAVAWLIGTLTMIAPAGMGVREGALGIMLQRVLAAGPAFTIAVCVRFWVLLVEVCWFALGGLLPNPEPPESPDGGA